MNYAVSGTASSGSDYSSLAGSVTIPAGSASATITVTPVEDTTVESSETVIVTLSSDASYTVGSSNSATVTIADSGDTGPVLVSLSTNRGAPGIPVVISGTGFGSTQASSRVTFNGTPSPVTSWSATSITATVPEGSTSGPVVVTVNRSSNGINFKVNGKLWPPGKTQGQVIQRRVAFFDAVRVGFGSWSASPAPHHALRAGFQRRCKAVERELSQVGRVTPLQCLQVHVPFSAEIKLSA